jgi:hypothetical protein
MNAKRSSVHLRDVPEYPFGKGAATFGLAALLAVALTAAATSPDHRGWRIAEGVAYENLAVFPVVSSQAADTSAFVTLDEAVSSGDAVVSEEGNVFLRSRDGHAIYRPVPFQSGGSQVNQLVLVNRGKRPIILLAGEIVSGGKQDRIVGKDRIVPVGGEPLPLDVFCVEHGRWAEASPNFAAAKMMVHPSVRERAAVERNQQEVWSAVDSGTTSLSLEQIPEAPPARISADSIAGVIQKEAPTESYRKIYASGAIGGGVESFSEQLSRRFERATANLKGERVVGVIVAYGDEVAWSDVFASPELFQGYWPKLLRSYAVEAMARPATVEHARVEDARDFLRSFDGHTSEESEPGVYRWIERTQGRTAEIELEALEPRPMVLHWLKVLRSN